MYCGIGKRTIATACALMLCASLAAQEDLRNVKQGEMVPEYQLTTMTGAVVDSAQSKGHVVVLIYLSAEQRSSERAVSDANQIVRELDREDVELVFLTADWIRRAYFEGLWEQVGVQAPLAFDAERKLYGQLGLIVFPTSIVVDREGRLSHVIPTRPSNYRQRLDAYLRHTLGLIDDEQLAEQLKARTFDTGSPKSVASRHRAAARLLREKGLLESAEQELAEALKLDAENVDIRLDMANLHLLMGKIEAAKETIDAVIKEEPKHRRAMLLRGIALYKMDMLDEAQAALQETLLLNPDPARTHFYLGQVYEKKGEKDKAIEHYREALLRLLDETID